MESVGTTEVDVLPEFTRNLASYQNLTVIVSDSVAAASTFDGPQLDWIFIDADHSYQSVLSDILAWAPCVRPGGLFSGHDYSDNRVRDAVTHVFGRVSRGPGMIWYTRGRPHTSMAMIAIRRTIDRLIRKFELERVISKKGTEGCVVEHGKPWKPTMASSGNPTPPPSGDRNLARLSHAVGNEATCKLRPA